MLRLLIYNVIIIVILAILDKEFNDFEDKEFKDSYKLFKYAVCISLSVFLLSGLFKPFNPLFLTFERNSSSSRSFSS